MDPDVCLQKIRLLIPALRGGHTHYAEELAELVEALDEWISKGGFLPADWQTEL